MAEPHPSEGSAPRYKRILLKLSGEAGVGGDNFGIDPKTLAAVCEEIAQVSKAGVQVCVVVGGGNIFRGAALAEAGMERASADYMGMLATVMNALAMQNALERLGVDTRVQSAIRHLEKSRVVICAAGTGNPFFTTDTAAALRAAEMGCDALLKGTSVDGVYTADPKKDASATRYSSISFDDAIAQNLQVLDATAFALCRDQKLPIKVFSIFKPGALKRVVMGEDEGTLVHV